MIRARTSKFLEIVFEFLIEGAGTVPMAEEH
jgi:hypothetical protein